ncbi:MAG: hypothetical protein KA463_03720 [Flavobacterium sp.]|jgi:hypothetical protein|uniref:hypothetical protein n=1 Tax=Flavobacterium sp. TaxID=239 RepID=UPI001B4E232D|nr:hypothetical protein [Flavobacterium sp.]MBP6146276.1 hypothetical protein [Flavobacterium sp.]MBP7182128.1 hypothetical protein [Flavobacterium sp.]MBP7318234.1 hypothetical protein [Flavobacterium sp.]MBP8887851.1 hypothetical protein [Flavobacterium sp.]HRL70125.1 hypothetical protein [Flavobacterium sp.]
MKKIALLILSTIVFGCITDDGLTDKTEYSKFIIGNSIATGINFMPEEIYSTNEVQKPLLKLKLITSVNFPCINYGLSISEFSNGSELIIRFDAIVKPEVCLTAIGPAISYIDLPESTKKITFINGKVIDKYAIEINQEKISITLIENNFTSSLFNKTFRIPENSFAYVCGTNTNNTNSYDDFLTILKQNPAFTEFKFEGEGRIPYPKSSAGNWVNHPSKFFIYSDFKEFKTLADILHDYSLKNIEKNAGVTIAIQSWNNIKYYSWINN